MNIFASSDCPKKSARALDDARSMKMLLECVQMMSTALICCGANESDLPIKVDGSPFQKSYHNHPANKWVRQTRGNYLWVLEHAGQLGKDFIEISGGKMHHCATQLAFLKKGAELIPEGIRMPFINISMFKKEADVRMAYRKTLIKKWIEDKEEPVWWGRSPPGWLNLEGILTERKKLKGFKVR